MMKTRRRLLRSLFFLTVAILPSSKEAGAQTSTAKTWQRWEQSISTPKSYAGCNPYRDVVLSVTYTSPTGQTYSGLGFWDGADSSIPGNTLFKLRAVFPTTGTWTWTTQRSGGPSGDRCGADSALAPRTGQIDVTASGGNQRPIYTLGGLRVSTAAPNPSRYLVHSNGTPFFWLGDTAWPGVWRGTAADWTSYLDQLGPPPGRRQQGFTVIQVAMPGGDVAQPLDASGQPPFLNDTTGTCAASTCAGTGAIPNPCCRWNPAFWQEFDRKVNEANNKGFVVVLVGLFKRVVGTQPWPALAEAKIYARSVAARLAGNHMIFSPGFDENPKCLTDQLCEHNPPACDNPSCNNTGVNDVNLACRATAIGNAVRTGLVRSTVDGKPLLGLVTHHLGGGCVAKCANDPATCCTADSWLEKFQAESWLDFQLFQSGQGGNCPFCGNPCANGDVKRIPCLTERARERPQGLYAFSPVKPNVNGEGVYDSLGKEPLVHNDTRARQAGYLSVLSGAFGYSLGVAGLWDWGGQTGNPNETGKTLSQGLSSTSSTQMKHLCTLLRNLEWQKLVPKPGRIIGQEGTTTCDPTTSAESMKMVYAIDGTPAWAGGGRFALAYLPPASATDLELETAGLASFGPGWCQQWFNPRTGTYGADFTGTPVTGTTRYRFTKPDGNDWVLLLKDPTHACWTSPPQFCPCLTASAGQYVCSTTP